MPTGLLEVSGTIDLAQFWPTGESDADTGGFPPKLGTKRLSKILIRFRFTGGLNE